MPSPRTAPASSPLIEACLFDLDGVVTRTAVLHAAAWKQMFDQFLAAYSARAGAPQPSFGTTDYERYVDGRPRFDGVRGFLASRGIELPEGEDADPPGAATVHGLGNAKQMLVQQRIQHGDVEVYPDAVVFLKAVRQAGMRTAVVSSSANTVEVLRSAGLEDLFDARIDGVVARDRGLPGKPAPDTFVAGAAELGLPPECCAVFEDALAGVEAGRAGGFGLVVGVDRSAADAGRDAGDARPDAADAGPDAGRRAAELAVHGADVVVQDLGELPVPPRSARGREAGQS